MASSVVSVVVPAATGPDAGSRSRAGVLARRMQVAERAVCDALQPFTLPALRMLLGLLFVWFGALKVTGSSPVEGLVSGTLPWVSPAVSVVGLGAVELALGASLLLGLWLRLVLPVLVAHLAGTFLTFVMLPQLMVSGQNPLLLTESGEFVVKNLVLISGALVLMTHARRRATGSSS